MDRRRFLGAAAVGLGYGAVGGLGASLGPLGGLVLPGSAASAATPTAWSAATGAPYVPSPHYPAGVHSGDPTPAAVVLHTRVDPALDGGAGVDVGFEVATNPAFSPPAAVVAAGSALATALTDHTVAFDVGGLSPATTYFYRFSAGGHASPVGRTRTAPAPGVDPGPVRFAYFSCQRFTHGYWPTHADLANLAADPATDLAFVLSLGDYVYDTGLADGVVPPPGRDDPVQNAVTLADFRAKYHLYQADVNLQAMHANYPVVCIFDNHDGLGAPGDAQAPGAIAAYFEHLPVRRFGGPDPDRIHRRFSWGSMAEVFLLDERRFRDPEVPSDGPLGSSSLDHPEMFDPDRTMLGADQRSWLLGGLTASAAQWKVLGSQLMFAPWRAQRFPDARAADPVGQRNAGLYLNMTQWDGYQGERQKILDAVAAAGLRDVMVVSGDSHLWSANEIQTDWDDPASPYVVVEFGGSSISSANSDEMGLPSSASTIPVLREANPHNIRFFESESHGYGLVELTASTATVQYRAAGDIRVADSPVAPIATFTVASGTSRIQGGFADTPGPTTTTATPVVPTPTGGDTGPLSTTGHPVRPSFTG